MYKRQGHRFCIHIAIALYCEAIEIETLDSVGCKSCVFAPSGDGGCSARCKTWGVICCHHFFFLSPSCCVAHRRGISREFVSEASPFRAGIAWSTNGVLVPMSQVQEKNISIRLAGTVTYILCVCEDPVQNSNQRLRQISCQSSMLQWLHLVL